MCSKSSLLPVFAKIVSPAPLILEWNKKDAVDYANHWHFMRSMSHEIVQPTRAHPSSVPMLWNKLFFLIYCRRSREYHLSNLEIFCFTMKGAVPGKGREQGAQGRRHTKWLIKAPKQRSVLCKYRVNSWTPDFVDSLPIKFRDKPPYIHS